MLDQKILRIVDDLEDRLDDLQKPTIDSTTRPHLLLSSTHTDSAAQAVTRGSLIYGDATPEWNELVLGGITGSLVTRDATDALWSAYAVAGTAAQTYTFPPATATLVGGTGAANRVTYWTGVNAIGSDAGLTVDAANDFYVVADAGGIRNASDGIRVQLNANASIQSNSAGNARGAFAVDWQAVRTNVVQVASGDYATISGGHDNYADSNSATVSGGYGNYAAATYATVSGGTSNSADGAQSTVGGGTANIASGDYSTVGGGWGNEAAGDYAAIAGGRANYATGDYSFAGGLRALTGANDGVFIWGDSTDADFNGIIADEFALRARGGFRHAYDDAYYFTQTVDVAGNVAFDTTFAAGTPSLTFNASGQDVDFYVEATGVADALFVQGSDGQITLGALTAGYVSSDAGGVLSVSATATPTAHAVLSASHSDAAVDAVSEGSLIVGNATPAWDELTAPAAAGRALVSTATSLAWSNTPTWTGRHTFSAGIELPDAQSIGITGNELLTVNAAGTFAFSGITGVTVEDADWIGNGTATARLGFDSSGATDYAYFSGCNVGIGTTTPAQILDVIRLTSDAQIDFTTGTGFSAAFQLRNNTVTDGQSTNWAFQQRNADNLFGAGARGLSIWSYRGATGGFIAPILLQEDGDVILAGATSATNGNVGIGIAAPTAKLHVDQSSTTAAIPVLTLDQADISEEYINFITAATTAGYPVDTATAVGSAYARLRVAVNGTYKYIQLYNA